jgi:dienelactone hydrolase
MTWSLELAAAALALLAPLVVAGQPVPRTLRADASHTFSVYVAGPTDARAGVVLVHDWFGVSPFFLGAAERHAREKLCRVVFLFTHSSRVPGFPARRRYTQVARVDDPPVGHASLSHATWLDPRA